MILSSNPESLVELTAAKGIIDLRLVSCEFPFALEIVSGTWKFNTTGEASKSNAEFDEGRTVHLTASDFISYETSTGGEIIIRY